MTKLRYRNHIRLRGYDYSDPGYYFVTICTRGWEKLFVQAIDSKYGRFEDLNVAARPWRAQKNTDVVVEKLHLISEKFNAFVDFYVVMPDHLHFILVLKEAPQGGAAIRTTKLPWIINAFKGWCTRAFGRPGWQPSFYEHVIRNEGALRRIRRYIFNNPRVEHEAIDWSKLDR